MTLFELIIFLLICAAFGFIGHLVSPRLTDSHQKQPCKVRKSFKFFCYAKQLRFVLFFSIVPVHIFMWVPACIGVYGTPRRQLA